MKKHNYYVVVEGDKYAFYEDKRLIAVVKSTDMNAEWLERYRANPRELLADLCGFDGPEVA